MAMYSRAEHVKKLLVCAPNSRVFIFPDATSFPLRPLLPYKRVQLAAERAARIGMQSHIIHLGNTAANGLRGRQSAQRRLHGRNIRVETTFSRKGKFRMLCFHPLDKPQQPARHDGK